MDKYTIENLELFYGDFKALKNINLNIKEKIALTMMAVNLVLYKMVRSLQKKSRGY